MNGINRAVHLDFHTPEGVYNFGEGFDAKTFADTLLKAHVTYINAFAQCNFGYAYYDTKIGVRYPTMQGSMFTDLLSSCHEVNIGVSAYINVGINNAQAALHPEWCRINGDGQRLIGDVKTNNASTAMCYNTDYRAFLLKMIQEIVALGVDGVFCDCMGFSHCYCPACLSKMAAAGVDIKDDDAVLRFAYESLCSLAGDIRSVVPQDKKLLLSFPGYDAVVGMDSHLEVECLPGGFGGWSYDYMTAQTNYARNLSDKALYMSGRFHASWGDFGGVKEKASIENDLYDALCNNVGFSVGDHMHPAGNLDQRLYRTIGEVFSLAERYEPYIKNTKYCAQIGVVRDKTSYQGFGLTDAIQGAARMLSELKYGFDIINEDMDFERYEVLLLPDQVRMTELLKKKLNRHIGAGRHVLSSGLAGYDVSQNRFVLSGYDFLETFGTDDATAGCYQVLFDDLGHPGSMYSAYSTGVQMKAKDAKSVLANHIRHYFDDKWDRPYFDYRWTTPHLYTYLPPEKASGYTAVAMQNNICHIAFEIFSCYHRYAAVFQKRLVDGILKRMIEEPLIKTKGIPSTARVTLTEAADYKLLHVKVTYPEARGKWFKVIEEHTRLPAGAVVSVKGMYQNVLLLPDKEAIPANCESGYTHLTLPEIEGYAMFQLQ